MSTGGRKTSSLSAWENSELDDCPPESGRRAGPRPEARPEAGNGSFFRSDHFSFVKRGVPAINPSGGVDYIGRPGDWGIKIMEDFIKNDYHKPSDKIRPDWDMAGAAEDLQLYLAVGYRVANRGPAAGMEARFGISRCSGTNSRPRRSDPAGPAKGIDSFRNAAFG